jgi:hypothetical protein
MDFVNETKLEAGWTLGFEPDGRELLIVAIKATFQIPKNGEKPELAEEQVPLTEADEFTDEPGFSATLYETDYAHRKPYCDVLLNGSTYAPDGKPTERVTVGIQVGQIKKSFNVVGDRFWDRILFKTTPTLPVKFVRKNISYDIAYGGTDKDKKDPDRVITYPENPIGIGYYPVSNGKNIVGKLLPNTEEIRTPVKKKDGEYLPMSFGAIGRNFASRTAYTGTYDQDWLDNRAPFWPDDFDYRYFQAAPTDQQMPYPKGGELVILQNLTPEGLTKFQIPPVSMPVIFIPYSGEDIIKEAFIDTILIEPDHKRYMLTCRVSLPLRKNCFELKQVIAGEMTSSWNWERRGAAKGRRYYKGISEYVKNEKV